MAEMTFEKALERLEKIVDALEGGTLPLEEALKRYEEGVRLVRACQDRLGKVEKRIEVLKKNLDGTLEAVPFEEEGNERREKGASRPKENP